MIHYWKRVLALILRRCGVKMATLADRIDPPVRLTPWGLGEW